MNKKIRILAISSSSKIGGGPSHIFLLSNLLEDNFDFYFSMPSIQDKSKNIDKKKYLEISERKISLIDILRLITFVKRNKINIIHAHGKGAGLIGRIIKIFVQKPLIYTFHGIHTDCYSKINKILYIIYENITGWIDNEKIFVSCSEKNQAKNLRIIIGNNYRIINNSTKNMDIKQNYFQNNNRVFGIDNNKKNIISVCRLVDQKNIFEIFKIARNLNIYNFIVLGEGYLIDKAKNYIKKNNIKNVYLLGNKKDIFKYLKESEIFLSTSLYEGHPISVLEAMSIGMPIVVSNVIGNIDTIKNNHSGFFYKVGDIIQASKCIKEIINNKELKLKFSINAYERHKELFSTKKMKDSYISLYKKYLI
tara:strand:+ start:1409 stop:2500 length:1092 start_codon:yes stop_codon:yes gene_type:complete